MIGRSIHRLSAQVDLVGGTRASVSLVPARGRWPEAETLDRLTLPLALAALCLLRADRGLSARVRHRMMSVAAALVEEPPALDAGESWTDRVAGCRLTAPGDAGQPRISLRLTETRAGPRAVLDGPAPTVLALSSATAATAASSLAMTTRDVHLAAALAIEGMLLWCRRPRTGRDAPQQAVGRGLAHARGRLVEVRMPAPAALLRALSEGHD